MNRPESCHGCGRPITGRCTTEFATGRIFCSDTCADPGLGIPMVRDLVARLVETARADPGSLWAFPERQRTLADARELLARLDAATVKG